MERNEIALKVFLSEVPDKFIENKHSLPPMQEVILGKSAAQIMHERLAVSFNIADAFITHSQQKDNPNKS